MRPGPARAAFGLAHLIVLGILGQAVLAGFFLYRQPPLIAAHLQVGFALVLLGLALLVLTWLARFERHHRLLPLTGILLIVLAIQLWLGLAGRDSTLAAALHVPDGLVAFAVAMLWLVRGRHAIREPRP
jgi:hypothetical protein